MIKENEREYFPLSLSQQNILALERTLSGTSVNNISTTVRIKGRLDFAVLTKVLNAIIEKDSSLRTRITNTPNGTVMQYCVPYSSEDFPVYDFTNTSTEGIENWETAVTREAIFTEDSPLYRFILFRDSEAGGGILVKLHHIIADGWSQIMLCNKIGKLYLEALSNNDIKVDVSPSYKLHIEEEQDYLKSSAFAKDERYWKSVAESIGEPSSLKNINGASVSPVGKRLSFNLPQIINHAIFSYCQEKRVAPFAVFYMALAIYFKRNGGDNRFTVGVPIVNRTNYIFKQSTGMFVSTLPFYNEIHDEWTLNEFNDDLTEKWYDLLRHQRYPFSKILEFKENDNRLFNIALSYQDSKIFESRDASVILSGRWHYCGYQAEQLTIHLTNLKNHQQYAVDYDYLAQFFTEEDIASLHRSICRILVEALDNPDTPLYRLNILSLEDKETVLYSFNDTDRYLEETSLFDAILKNSKKHLNRVAVINKGERTTYGALLHKGAQYAEVLGPYTGDDNALVAIFLPRSVELFAAMVGTVQQECAYMLISNTLPTERIKIILEQSGAAVLITDDNGKRKLDDLRMPVLTTDDANNCYGIPTRKESTDASAVGDKLAYVVYTSGSTGEPKGVEITQRNLLNFSQEMSEVYGRGAVLSVCNIGFDAFMLESIVALLNGRTVVLPDDIELESAERLASLINGYAVSFISLTPSRLSAFLRVDAFKNVMWKMESIVCGGEAFPHELLKKIKECSLAHIYNQYGPSETTVAVSMKELSQADKITAGAPLGNCKLYVLDEHMNPLPIGGNGKLFVGGKCVGHGYRNRPDLTEAAFKSNPFVHDDTIYDTGDIAHWTPSGEIVLTGRADRQVKLRGLRIELQEVSSCIESYPDVSTAHAVIRIVNYQQVLGIYYISDKEISNAALLSHAATYLPGYMIPSFFVRLDQFPFTANGKIDENALPMPSINEEPDEITPAGERVLEIFKDILHTSDICVSTDYFLAGGNSLNAMEALIEIENVFGRRLRVADLYVYRTAAKLGAFLDNVSTHSSAEKNEETAVITKAKPGNRYTLTPVQQGMYIQTMLSPDGLVYNMPGVFRMAKKVDVDLLEASFAALIAEDPIFRTKFICEDGEVVSQICDSVSFNVQRLAGESIEAVSASFFRPFDLSKAPLIRAGIWTSEDDEDILFFDCHHIISDGLSTSIILRRLDKLMSGQKANTHLNFYDYLSSTESVKKNKSDLDFWLHTLENLPEPLVLPADKEKPARFDYLGDELTLSFTEAESRKIGDFCRESGDTEYGLFLGAFALVMSCLSGKNDIIIGAPVSGRYLKDTDSICGPFINTLPLRLRRSEDMTVGQWLEHARLAVAGMLDHQSTGLEDIISELKLPRGEYNALYRIMLTQTPVKESDLTLGDNKMIYLPISTGNVKMDLILELSGDPSGYTLRFSYATSLFERETVALWSRYVKEAVLSFIKGDEAKLCNLDLLSSEDREKLVDNINYSVTPFVNRPIHNLLKMTAARKASECAVISNGNNYTYANLEQRASFIADHLEGLGINSGTVAICMRRGFEMIATMYGVLKAGCAYTFLQENLPEARLRYMLEASVARCLIKDGFVSVSDSLTDGLNCPIIHVPEGTSTDNRANTVASGIANVLFTSGSTGRPKGVMLKHRSLANLFGQMKDLLDDVPGNVLCSTNCIFDCFVVETLIALALGRCVIMADEEEMLLPWKLARLIEKYETTVFEMTPSRFRMCLGNEDFRRAARHIGIVLLGGEAVSRTLVDDFYACSNGRLMNMYGPTEATVFTTMCHLLPGEFVTIGRPLQNTRTYVLDENLMPVLPTSYGEMYIAGECIAEGYASSPDQTNASFVGDIVFDGERMYKTGDIVRLRADGRYDYIGRTDDQIKLNGQRVELTEINGAILATAKALHAVTVGVKNNDASMSLCSFFVPVDNASSTDIIKEIKKVLPKYMIPSRLIPLDKMPMTATNKIDMVTLKELAESETVAIDKSIGSCDTNNVAPTQNILPDNDITGKQINTNTAKDVTKNIDNEYVFSIWNKVLSSPVSDTDISFFDCGGTSLAALSVLSFYYNDRLEMSISDFYENPTVSAQVAFLNSGISAAKSIDEPTKMDIDVTSESVPALQDSLSGGRDILITGATGFFGAHLVHEIISRAPSSRVLCLVRDGSEARLRERLEWYFSKDITDKMMQNIEVIRGDIAKEGLGLSVDETATLVSRIGKIYHCAADVRHYCADEDTYMKINVGGTYEMIELARRSKAKLYHMSTCSVGGGELKNGNTSEFTENDFDIGQEWQRNIYVKSKFLAEKAVFEAIDSGVDAIIFRLGRLVGRESDGKFQHNPESNMFYLLMKSAESIGVIPNVVANVQWDFMPVDMAAEQVVLLSEASGRVFHIINQDPPSLGELFCAVSDSHRVVSPEEFNETFCRKESSINRVYATLIRMHFLPPYKEPKIKVTCDVTADTLKRMGYSRSISSLKTAMCGFKKGE